MTRTEFAELIRENSGGTRVDLRGLKGGLYAIAGAILLLALLMLPVTILACEAIYAQVLLREKMEEMKQKHPG